MKKQTNILILFSLVLFTFGCEKEETKPDIKVQEKPTDDTPVIQAKRVKITLNSSFGDIVPEYDIEVYLPASFETNKDLPVIYLLNGDINKTIEGPGNISGDDLFDRTINISKVLNHDAIIVYIDTDESPSYDWHTSNQGQNFYGFLTSDLIPFINETYENDNTSRTIVTHGSAAKFGLYVMILGEETDNSYFQNFVCSDPYGLNYLIRQLETDNFPISKNEIKLYLSFSQETLDLSDASAEKTLRRFADLITFKQYPWLSIYAEEHRGFTHLSVIEPSFTNGLKFAFDLE